LCAKHIGHFLGSYLLIRPFCVICCFLFGCVPVLTELSRSAKALSELAGRTDPVVGDVVVAMVEMGKYVFYHLCWIDI
jgi:hypothetical protein